MVKSRSKLINFIFIILLGLTTAQRTSSRASVSVSASSLSDLQQQVEEASKNAFAAIESDGSTAEKAVQTLATALASAIAGIMIDVLRSGNVDAVSQSQQISEVVGNALTTAATGQFASLDVSSIVSSVESIAQQTLSNADADVSPVQLTTDVANAVVETIADSLGQVLGVQISTETSITATVTPAAWSLGSAPQVDRSNLEASLKALLEGGDVQAMVSGFASALQGDAQDIIAEVLVDAANDDALKVNLVAFFSGAFQSDAEAFPVFGLSSTLSTAVSQPNGNALIAILSQAITQANNAGPTPALSTALPFLVATDGPALDLFFDAFSDAIQAGGCNSVGLVLGDANDQAISKGMVGAFQSKIKSVPEINNCLKVGISLKVSVGILQSIKENPSGAVDLIVKAAQDKQPSAISNAIIQAVEDGETTALSKVITDVLGRPDLPADQLTLAFTLAMQLGSPEVQKTVSQIASSPTNLQPFSALISYAFTVNSSPNTTESFVNIIQGSVNDDGACALAPAMESALDEADTPQDILDVVLANPSIAPCVKPEELYSPTSILNQFSTSSPEDVSKIIINAISSGQSSSVIQALIEGISQPNGPSTVTSIVTSLMTSPDITPEQITFIINSISSTQSPEANIITNSFRQVLETPANLTPNIIQTVYNAILNVNFNLTSPIGEIMSEDGCDKMKPILDAVEQLASTNNQQTPFYTFAITNDQFRECFEPSKLFTEEILSPIVTNLPVDITSKVIRDALQAEQTSSVVAVLAPLPTKDITPLLESTFQYDISPQIIIDFIVSYSQQTPNANTNLQDVLTQMNTIEIQPSNFIEAIFKIIISGPQNSSIVLGPLQDLIEGNDCAVVQNILDTAQAASRAANQSQVFSEAIIDNRIISRCFKSDDLYTTEVLVRELGRPVDQIVDIFMDALSNGQVTQVSDALIQEVADTPEKVSNLLLSLVCAQGDVNPNLLTQMMEALVQGRAIDVVSGLIEQIGSEGSEGDLCQLPEVIYTSLVQNEGQLIEPIDSIINDKGCDENMVVVVKAARSVAQENGEGGTFDEVVSQISLELEQCLLPPPPPPPPPSPPSPPPPSPPTPPPPSPPSPPPVDIEEVFGVSSVEYAPTPTQTPTPSPTPTPTPAVVLPSPIVLPSATPLPTLDPTPNPTPPETLKVQYSFRYEKGTRVLIGGCHDIQPPGQFTCEQQVNLGKCARNWMLTGSFCAKLCGYCEDECLEIEPDEQTTCSMVSARNQCNSPQIESNGFCKQTCGKCAGAQRSSSPDVIKTLPREPTIGSIPTPSEDEFVCTDISPDLAYTCDDQKRFGKCNSAWMISGGFCSRTCERCGTIAGDIEEAAPITPTPTPTTKASSNDGQCDCGCSCCDLEAQTSLVSDAVSTAVSTVLKELRESGRL